MLALKPKFFPTKTRVFVRNLPAVIKILFGRRIPLRVTQVITYRCNLDCEYCSRHWEGGHELSSQEVCRIMESFREAGCLNWSFNGGEPLIRRDIGELIFCAKNLGMQVSLNSNGTLVATRIRDLKHADIVSVSVDGLWGVHDRLRRGSFDRLVSGLKALRDSGIRTTFMSVIAAHNLDCLQAILELASEFQATVFFQPIRVQSEDKLAKARDYFPQREAMAAAIDSIIKAKVMGWPVGNSDRYLRAIRECWPDRMPLGNCWAGKLYCFMTPEGYVTACCDTLARTQKDAACNASTSGCSAFLSIPDYDCETCFSAIPLEANIAMDSLRRNPLAFSGQFFRQLLSFRTLNPNLTKKLARRDRF
jgi:MoaA/NifB/PqqE/SkfB family radical SAM enzyme